MNHKILPAFLFLSTVFVGVADAQSNPPRPEMPSVIASKAPKIDGVLDDECWKSASAVTDFYLQTDDKAPEKTEAYVCYDQKSIYVAFYCHASRPELIRHEQSRRRGSMGSDDRVDFYIDTFNSLQWDQRSRFTVSAGGCQSERMSTGSVSKTEWRGDWYAGAKVVADGFIVEMEIPWIILQYDNSKGYLGIMFNRWYSAADRDHASPKMGTNWDPYRWYIWKGLQLPKSVRRPMAMPYMLFSASQKDTTVKTGVDMRYDPNSQSTAVLSLLPDFSSIEQGVDSVSFSYNEQQQGDNRPFFQEGGSYFPGSDMLYTRRLGDIDLGAKYFSRIGSLNYGLMHVTATNGDSAQSVSATNQYGSKGSLSAAVVRSDYQGAIGTTSGIGGGYNLYRKNDTAWDMWGQVGQANNGLGEGTGTRMNIGTNWGAGRRKLGYWAEYNNIDANYKPAIGYFPDVNFESYGGGLSLWDDPNNSPVKSWWFGCDAGESYYKTGELFQRNWSINGGASWLKGYSIWMNSGGAKRPPHQDRLTSTGVGWGQTTLFRGGGASYTSGNLASGHYMNWSVSQGWNLGPSLNMNLNYTHSQLDEPSPDAYHATQMIASFAYEFPTLTHERTVIGRFVNQDSHTNFYLAYRQNARSGMDIYVTLGNPNAETTEESITVKLLQVY